MSRAGTIDGLQFARGREAVSGSIGGDDLPRLAAMGCEVLTLGYTVRGGASSGGRPSLTIEISGRLRLVCQRCLGPLELPLAVVSELELAETQAEINAADDDIDRVLATRSMDVAALVEDEAILALPMVPLHERCEAGVAREPPRAAQSSPFAALDRLRKGGAGREGSRR
jgi:uncharacterized protein